MSENTNNNANDSANDTEIVVVPKYITIFSKVYFQIFILLILYWLLPASVYLLAHSSAVPDKTAKPQVIDVSHEPIQSEVSFDDIIVDKGNKRWVLSPAADYSISGIVAAKKDSVWQIGFSRSDFERKAFLDLVIVWGPIADKKIVEENFKFNLDKTDITRVLSTKFKKNRLPKGYNSRYITHNNLVPANDNIVAALLKIRKWDKVKLGGFLINMKTPDRYLFKTSLSREDYGWSASEIIYVTSVQIGDKVYK